MTEQVMMVDNPAKLPPVQDIQRIEEPIIMASLITPETYVGSLIELCQERSGHPEGNHVHHQGSRTHQL